MQEISYVDLIDYSVKQKLISPLCQLIVDKYLPTTLAPNTITLIGFIVNILPFILLIITDIPGQPASAWISMLQGLCIIIYSVKFNNSDMR